MRSFIFAFLIFGAVLSGRARAEDDICTKITNLYDGISLSAAATVKPAVLKDLVILNVRTLFPVLSRLQVGDDEIIGLAMNVKECKRIMKKKTNTWTYAGAQEIINEMTASADARGMKSFREAASAAASRSSFRDSPARRSSPVATPSNSQFFYSSQENSPVIRRNGDRRQGDDDDSESNDDNEAGDEPTYEELREHLKRITMQ